MLSEKILIHSTMQIGLVFVFKMF